MGCAYQSRQVRAAQSAAPQHQIITATNFATAQSISGIPYITIGDYRNRYDFSGGSYVLPVGRGAVAVALGARMYGELGGVCRLHCAHDVQKAVFVLVAQPGLYRDRHICGYCATGSGGNVVYTLRVLEDDRATVGTVYGFGGAAEVEINAKRTKLGSACRVLRHHLSLAAQYLHIHGYASAGSATVLQFRA